MSQSAWHSEKGFTLVELAVVMIIIGLLIGGVLKGQEFAVNARVNSTVTQIKAINAAIGTFHGMYQSYPGDMPNANTRLPNCVNPSCNNSNGNGRIDRNVDAAIAPTLQDDSLQFWVHMQKADLFSGVTEGGFVAFGERVPASDMGGGFRVGFSANGALPNATNGGLAGSARAGHWLALTGDTGPVTTAMSEVFRPSLMKRLDDKIDDGHPNDGVLRAVGTAGPAQTDCASAADLTGQYNEVPDSALCGAYIRLSN